MLLHRNIFHYPFTIHLQQWDHIGSSLQKNNSIVIFSQNQSIHSPLSVSIGWLCIKYSTNLIKNVPQSPLHKTKNVMLTILNIIIYIMKCVLAWKILYLLIYKNHQHINTPNSTKNTNLIIRFLSCLLFRMITFGVIPDCKSKFFFFLIPEK